MKRVISMLLVISLCLGISVTALAADTGEIVFTDVDQNAWYYEAVHWAVENQITNGITDTTFGVSDPVTRAMMVTFLWRMNGCPAPETVRGFADVPDGIWYSDAINWAAEQGIANGMSSTEFCPDGVLTREQAATFLYREVERSGGGFHGLWEYRLDYADTDQISDWAFEAVSWMNMQGILQGYNGELTPKAFCTRASAVTMLYRFAVSQPILPPAEDPHAYSERAVPVLRESVNSSETATLRFYEDMPNVPYMEIKEYYDTFYLLGTDQTEGLTEYWNGSGFVLQNLGGYIAQADPAADTIFSSDLFGFTCPAYYLLLEVNDESDENYPFLESRNSIVLPETPRSSTLRLGDYGIDLRADSNGLYLPLGTLSDLYANTALVYTVYNGEKIYLVDYIGTLQPVSALMLDDQFSAPFAAQRPADLADFTYRELCFNLDTFYGRPGQEYIHDALSAAKLDTVLSSQYPRIKSLLLSADSNDFYNGLSQLLYGLLYDGGHTGITSTVYYENAETALDELFEANYGSGFLTTVYKTLATAVANIVRQQQLYNWETYVAQGDTAIIRLDDFTVDTEAWKAFYAGQGEMPLEGDSLGTVYAYLEQAAANPEIKNVVIDITCNGGGNSAAMNAIEWLLTGESSTSYANRLTGQVSTEEYQLDANFDGVFDANDRPFTQFRYGVLTSSSSFSAANAFAFFMYEHGAMILGEQSGGGACAIRISTAGGIEFSSSDCSACIVNGAGDSVDYGCPVDAELFKLPAADDVNDVTELISLFAELYDLTSISNAMNDFFGAAEAPAA